MIKLLLRYRLPNFRETQLLKTLNLLQTGKLIFNFGKIASEYRDDSYRVTDNVGRYRYPIEYYYAIVFAQSIYSRVYYYAGTR